MPISTIHALYPVAEIRSIEQAALASLPPYTLMERAGGAAADLALKLIGAGHASCDVLVLAGPGNNGGDALEAATCLAHAGINVTVLPYFYPDRQSDDSRQALARAKNSSIRFANPTQYQALALSTQWALIIDGLFGIGLTRAIAAPLNALIEVINTLPCPILALDVPSGLDADTGNIVGENDTAVSATHTITFIADKPGLHTGSGRDHAGEIHVASLDIETRHFPPPHAHLGTSGLFADHLQPRKHNVHKGTYGDAIVLGGAPGMSGAVILAACTAAKCGTGRVFAAFLNEPPAYDSAHPELMCRRAQDIDLSSGALIVGPGLGMSDAAHHLLSAVIDTGTPLVLDADALNIIAAEPALQDRLRHRQHPALITPHPLEAARLLGVTAAQVQTDRVRAARSLAHRFNSVAILKGSGSVIARPDGEVVINTTGNPALATAGTGDVLAGACGALLAQSWPVWQAALAAVWLHGHAADMMVSHGIGPIGAVATDLIPFIRRALNQLVAANAQRPASG